MASGGVAAPGKFAFDLTPGRIATPKQTLSADGTTTLYTPASGNAIRLLWLYLKTPESNSSELDITIKIGADMVYRTSMSRPDVFSHTLSGPQEGAADATLTLTVGPVGAGAINYPVTIYVNADLEEF